MRVLTALILLLALVAPARARATLTYGPTFYVAPEGLDAPLPSCSNPATPCKSIQHIWNELFTKYDLAMHRVTIQLSDGEHGAPCNPAGCGPHAQMYAPLLGQQTDNELVVQGSCGNPSAASLRAAVDQANFVIGHGAAVMLRCLRLDGFETGQDQIVMGGGWLGLDRVTFARAPSRADGGGAPNHVSCDMGAQIVITGNLWFEDSAAQAGFYGSKGCGAYLNVNNVPGLLAFTFVGANRYSAAFVWLTSAAAFNFQGLGVGGTMTGRFAVVKGASNLDLGVTALASLPGTLPSIADGATDGSIMEDAGGTLQLWNIPAGIVSGTTRASRIDCWGITTGGGLAPHAPCTVRSYGAGAFNLQNHLGATYAQDIPAGMFSCFGYIARVGNHGGPPYFAAQSNCPGVTQEGMDFNLLGNQKSFRFIARSPTQFLAALGVDGFDLRVPLKINGTTGITATKTVYGDKGWCTLAFTSGVLTGGSCAEAPPTSSTPAQNR